jgi:hypothetical protein
MKNKQWILLFSFCVSSCFATFHGGQFNGVRGAMNVWQLNGSSKGDYLFYSDWALADLQAITADNRTFELAPNVSTYANATSAEDIEYYISGDDGSKWMEAITVWERTTDGTETGASFTFSVDTWNNLDSRYEATAFIQLLDSADPDYPVLNGHRQSQVITSTTAQNVTLSLNFAGSSYSNKALQVGFKIEGINANPDTDWGSVTVTAHDAVANIPDTLSPSPNPMVFSVNPYPISDNAITMVASNAVDNAYGVEYYFQCTAGPGNDSGWQGGATYTDTGLASGQSYSYRVAVRDTSPAQNITVPSTVITTNTPGLDLIAPTPDPMQIFSSEVNSSSSITLTATNATDASSVEYYFTALSDGAEDSGWQSSPVYTDFGLLPGTAYEYTVQARDLSSATNYTAVSLAHKVVTSSEIPAIRIIPNGDFETGGDQWINYEPNAVTLSYESSGGSGDGGGYVRHGREIQTGWAVLVSPAAVLDNGTQGISLADLRVSVGDTVTFTMDHKTEVGENAPSLKVEFMRSTNTMISNVEESGVYSASWTTLTFDAVIPPDTHSIKFVPVAGAADIDGTGSVFGYDNIGIVPAALTAPQPSIANVGGDGTVSITCDGISGQQYIIQCKQYLSDDGWITDNSQPVDVTENGVINMSLSNEWNQAFYRVLTQ